MKTKFNFRKTNLILLISTIALLGCSSLKNKEQTSSELKDFKVIVEKTEKGIKMQSVKGSAWIDLSFSLNNYQPQAIDEFGMTELDKKFTNNNAKLADFLFTISKTEYGIALKGIEGTAWKDLTFTLNENGRQAIDQFGMIKLN